MGTILRINSELARKNPEQVYTRPADIIGEIGLTRGQKIAALKRWEGPYGAIRRRFRCMRTCLLIVLSGPSS